MSILLKYSEEQKELRTESISEVNEVLDAFITVPALLGIAVGIFMGIMLTFNVIEDIRSKRKGSEIE